MSNYVENNLVSGETVRYAARISLWKYWFNFLSGGVLMLGSVAGLVGSLFGSGHGAAASMEAILVLIALVLLGWPFVARRSTELVITDKRLIAKYGVVSTQSIEIRFEKIETVRVTQGLVGKLLNFGDVVVTGTGSTFDPIRNVANAMTFRAALNQAMERGG